MKMARWAAIILLSIVALAAVAPEVWAPAHYATQFRDAPDARPSSQFPLGTDALGRDRLSRLLYGTSVSLLLAPAAALLSCLVAGLLGGVAGLGRRFHGRGIFSLPDLFFPAAMVSPPPDFPGFLP